MYWMALTGLSLRAAFARPWRALFMLAMLALQDFLFFVLWMVFFRRVSNVNGWHLPEVATLFALTFTGMGLASFITGGARRIGKTVVDGGLDVYLTQPRDALLALILSEVTPAGAGHMLCGLGMMVFAASLPPAGIAIGLAASLTIAGLFVAMQVMFQSLAFFMRGGDGVGLSLMSMLSSLAMIPQNTQARAMRLVLYTVLPAGFMVILPVEAIHRQSLLLLAVLAGAVIVYWLIARFVFRLGLRRYTSALAWRM